MRKRVKKFFDNLGFGGCIAVGIIGGILYGVVVGFLVWLHVGTLAVIIPATVIGMAITHADGEDSWGGMG